MPARSLALKLALSRTENYLPESSAEMVGAPLFLYFSKLMEWINVTGPGGEAIGLRRSDDDVEPYPDVLEGDPPVLNSWLEATRIEVVSAVDWRLSPTWELGPRVIHDNMWFWIRDGTGRAYLDGHERFRIEPGGTMLIPPNTVHVIRPDPGMAMSLVTVHFLATSYGGMSLLDLLGFPAWLPPSDDAPYERVNESLLRESMLAAPGRRLMMASGVREVLLYAIRSFGSSFKTKAHPDLPRMAPALNWIESHLSEPIRVGDLAARVHLSEVQFRKIFKRVTGLSPNQFIQRRRIGYACDLLREESLSVDQVARATGFRETPFFYRVFKKWVGTTPGNYREFEI